MENKTNQSTSNVSNINWFPGHMTKAKREMSEKIKLVDLVIEIRDSRIPQSSENPLLNEIIGQKPRLIILSKADKSEKEATSQWIHYFQSMGYQAISLDLIHDKNIPNIVAKACFDIMKTKIEKLKAKGLKRYEIKAMVVGCPNVGKSTFINAVNKKKVAQTADHPGVTKNLSWIKVSNEVALLDTPGVLWPKFEDQMIGYRLAVVGTINDQILPISEIVEYGIDYISKKHPERLQNRYGIDVASDVHTTIERIGQSRKTFLQDQTLDYKRLHALILKEIRDNQLGPITWEYPDENN